MIRHLWPNHTFPIWEFATEEERVEAQAETWAVQLSRSSDASGGWSHAPR
jgi:hypothetical protein